MAFTPTRPWRRVRARLAQIGLVFGLVLLTLGCGGSSGDAGTASGAPGKDASAQNEDAGDTIPIRVSPVKREPLSSLYSTSTNLRAEKQATVTARTRGVVRRLVVEEGAQVAPGQDLVALEDDEQRIEVARAEAARATKARELERAEQLHGKGLLSDEVYETARREANEAEQAAALARLNLSRTVVRAPFAGRILKRHVDVGATVSDGTAVYDLADLEPLYADINVPEQQVSKLSLGQRVRLTTDVESLVVEARIERIAPAVDPSTGTVKVTLALAPGHTLRPGAFVRVNIVTDTHPRALVVPRSALVAEGRRWHLFRLGADKDKVEKIEVRLGYEEGDRVEVLDLAGAAGQLEPGMPVVVIGASALTDGARVRVVEEEPAQEADGAAPAARAGEPGGGSAGTGALGVAA